MTTSPIDVSVFQHNGARFITMRSEGLRADYLVFPGEPVDVALHRIILREDAKLNAHQRRIDALRAAFNVVTSDEKA